VEAYTYTEDYQAFYLYWHPQSIPVSASWPHIQPAHLHMPVFPQPCLRAAEGCCALAGSSRLCEVSLEVVTSLTARQGGNW